MTTAYGPIRVKVKLLDGVEVGAKPEYEDCRRAADAHGVPLRAVYAAVGRHQGATVVETVA
ncbi:MAG: nickel insertion protein [Caldilineaceae bacterium]